MAEFKECKNIIPVDPCVHACALPSLAASAASPCQTSLTSGCRDGFVVEGVAAAVAVDAVDAAEVVAVVDLTDCGCDCSETASGGPLGAVAPSVAPSVVLAGVLAGVLSEVLAGEKREGRRLSWARCWIGLELLVLLVPLALHDTPLRVELQAPEHIFVMTEIREEKPILITISVN